MPGPSVFASTEQQSRTERQWFCNILPQLTVSLVTDYALLRARHTSTSEQFTSISCHCMHCAANCYHGYVVYTCIVTSVGVTWPCCYGKHLFRYGSRNIYIVSMYLYIIISSQLQTADSPYNYTLWLIQPHIILPKARVWAPVLRLHMSPNNLNNVTCHFLFFP